jgi:hypothetical protein
MTTMKNKNITSENIRNEKITRKEALGRAGKYAAFTAASMLLVLDNASAKHPKKSPKKPRPRSV